MAKEKTDLKDPKTETGLVPISNKMSSINVLAPDIQMVESELRLIKKFQAIVKSQLIEGLDYGVIPHTKKPTLLKPGAEKMAKLCHLADSYSIMTEIEDWQKGLFYYKVKCSLTHIESGQLISEGMGSCNSQESKYRYRWCYEKDVPTELDKSKIPNKIIKAQSGGSYRMYRIDNDDIYSQVNTLLKMAKKRALVDATLSACRLSAVFEQDLEDFSTTDELSNTMTSEKFWSGIHELNIDNDKIIAHCSKFHSDWKVTHPEDINALSDDKLRILYKELKESNKPQEGE